MKSNIFQTKSFIYSSLPRILILSNKNFIADKLCQRLLAQNCQITYISLKPPNFLENEKGN